jgi:hypothetical protein
VRALGRSTLGRPWCARPNRAPRACGRVKIVLVPPLLSGRGNQPEIIDRSPHACLSIDGSKIFSSAHLSVDRHQLFDGSLEKGEAAVLDH